MILERRNPYSPLPALTERPRVIESRGGLEFDRFFPEELVHPTSRVGDAGDVALRTFVPRWWPPPPAG